MKILKTIIAIIVIFGVFGSVAFLFGNRFTGVFSPDTETGVFESESASDYNSAMSEDNIFSNLTMSCIGDSITMATQIEKPYPTCVQELLGLSDVYNYGVSWSTIGHMEDCHCHPGSDYDHDPYVYRYDEIQDADIICVMGGVNDWGCLIPLGTPDDMEPFTFYGALNMLAAGLKENHPNSYIFFMTGFDYYGVENVDAYNRDRVYWREFNEAIVSVCQKYNIDCFDVFHQIPVDRGVDMIDGIHPTQEFVKDVWSPAIAEFIRQNYK